MRVTLANAELISRGGLTMFVLRVGGVPQETLTISVVLDSKCRHFDSTLIADKLREMADKLEKCA